MQELQIGWLYSETLKKTRALVAEFCKTKHTQKKGDIYFLLQSWDLLEVLLCDI